MSSPLKIVAMGKHLPARQVHAAELEEELGLEPGWIMAKNGVATRYYAHPDESNSDLGAKALQKALDKAGMAYQELDLILNASGSYDYPIPETSALIQKKMGQGKSGIPSFSVDATCLSFVAALDVAAAFMQAGRYRTIAIVSTEISSRSLNPDEKESATLLGDGAAAAIVQKVSEQSSALLSSHMETYGDGAFYTCVKGGGNARHPRSPEVADSEFTFHMNGPAVLGMAFRKLRPVVKKLFSELDFSLQEVDLFVPHQASKVALEKAQKFFRLSDQQFVNYLSQHGNCIAASIPMALHDAIEAGRIQRGGRICLLGTAAGLSVGGAVLIY